MRTFVDAQPARVRDAASCLTSGPDALIRCAGAVIVNGAGSGCLEVGSKNASQHTPARIARCLGGEKQRWHLVATSGAFTIKSAANGDCLEGASSEGEADEQRLRQAACTGADSQLFVLHQDHSGTSLVATPSGLCIGPAPVNRKPRRSPRPRVMATRRRNTGSCSDRSSNSQSRDWQCTTAVVTSASPGWSAPLSNSVMVCDKEFRRRYRGTTAAVRCGLAGGNRGHVAARLAAHVGHRRRLGFSSDGHAVAPALRARRWRRRGQRSGRRHKW